MNSCRHWFKYIAQTRRSHADSLTKSERELHKTKAFRPWMLSSYIGSLDGLSKQSDMFCTEAFITTYCQCRFGLMHVQPGCALMQIKKLTISHTLLPGSELAMTAFVDHKMDIVCFLVTTYLRFACRLSQENRQYPSCSRSMSLRPTIAQ